VREDFNRLIVSVFCSFLGLTLLILLISCGGSGGDSTPAPTTTTTTIVPTLTPPAKNIVGTYVLRGFIERYSDGETVTQDDFSSFSGTMVIGADTISQSWVVNDESPVDSTGTYSIIYPVGTGDGTFHITDSSGTYDLLFTISGNTLSIYSGVVPLEDGRTVEELDTWEKTSDDIGIATKIVKDQSAKSRFRLIGHIITQMNLNNNHKLKK
jgi:hypothetical protein